MKLVPAYRQPCFLPTPPTPDGNIDLDFAAPEPATAASTPPTSCADFASLAGYRFPPALCATPLMGRNLLSSLFFFVYTRKEGFVFSKTEN